MELLGMKGDLQLRPASDQDAELLFRIFIESRPDITNATHIASDVRNQLLQSQYLAQTQHYAANFPNADSGIIHYGNSPVGRLCVNRSDRELHIIDLAVLAEFRSQGIGATLMKALQEEARLTGRSVRIHVEKESPAVGFYQRHGFQQIGEKPLHWEMRWTHDSSDLK